MIGRGMMGDNDIRAAAEELERRSAEKIREIERAYTERLEGALKRLVSREPFYKADNSSEANCRRLFAERILAGDSLEDAQSHVAKTLEAWNIRPQV